MNLNEFYTLTREKQAVNRWEEVAQHHYFQCVCALIAQMTAATFMKTSILLDFTDKYISICWCSCVIVS